MLTLFHKTVLGVLAIGFLLVALVVSARTTAAAPTAAPAAPAITVSSSAPAPGIVVTGEAKIDLPPTTAYLTLGVSVQAASAAEAQGQLTPRVARILERAAATGVPAKDIRHSSFNINPQYAYDAGKAPRVSGFQASQQIALEMSDFDAVSKLLDAVVREDAATSASVRFSVDEDSPLVIEARGKAVQDARRKAEAIAAAAGARLGAALSVTDAGQAAPGYKQFGGATAGGGGPGPQFPGGDSELVFRVQVQFAIETN
ncbi:MAG: SIMPL domain-containing protein [Candidatus Limnocylindria bacterium]